MFTRVVKPRIVPSQWKRKFQIGVHRFNVEDNLGMADKHPRSYELRLLTSLDHNIAYYAISQISWLWNCEMRAHDLPCAALFLT